MSIETVFDAAKTRLTNQLPALVPVLDTDEFDDNVLPTLNGAVKPFVVFHAGSSETTKNRRSQGIISPVLDPIDYDFIVEAVGATASIARTVFGQCRTALLGYTLTGSTMLKLDSTQEFNTPKTDTKPATYHTAGMFTGITNL